MLARILLSLVLGGLFGCGGNTRAPVEDRVSQPAHPVYTVKRGDTLYSIAFRYGLDYRNVAFTNGIGAPYTIYPGQTIQLARAATPTALVGSRAEPAKPGSAPLTTMKTPGPIPTGPTGPTEPTVAMPAPAPVIPSVPAKSVSTKPPTTPVKQQTDTSAYVGGEVKTWRWPTAGRVTRSYSGSVHKGIDIGGNRGDPVVAVAPGKVVYAGTGIAGFGELLIVKHNDLYLSAYGHNDRILVVEGDTVAVGQTIAEKGSSGTDTVKLHFEIRKEGKPIDPQRLLPKR